MDQHETSELPEPNPVSQDSTSAHPEADIIILSMDRSDDTIAAIDSALAQRDVNLRVWVVDQGSSQDTIERLRRHVADKPLVHLEITGRNLGIPGGRNVATRFGSAPVVVSLDNDAVFCSETEVAKAIRRLESDTSLAAIGFRILNFFSRADDERSWGYPKSLRPQSDREFVTTRFVGAGHALRRSAFEAVGGYDADLFFYWEELDVSYRLINAGYRILYAPEISIFHKVSPEHRVHWAGGRFYYLVRNRLYIEYKYGTSVLRLAALAGAYMLKGLHNDVGGQAARAAWDAVGMCRRYRLDQHGRDTSRLSPDALTYIFNNDLRYRGSLWQRLRRELWAKLPGKA
ncbi:MAG: glycosyltransferase family 2 protein [Dongiaceae bacterium]